MEKEGDGELLVFIRQLVTSLLVEDRSQKRSISERV